MKITFLGTGTSQGVPVIGCHCEVCNSLDYRDKRLRTSVMIELNNLNLVIDSGPDFRQQMLREKVQKIDAILYTHEHKDHTAGMDDIRAFNFKHNMDMPIYGRINVLNQLKQEFSYVFSGANYPGLPKVVLNIIENKPFEINYNLITPVEVLHGKIPVFGFRFNNFAYITDANFISNEEKNKLKNLDVLVLNALRIQPHISHFTLQEAIEVVKELNPKKAYFTHISHYLGLHSEIDPKLPPNIYLAYDGLKIEI